MPYQNLSYLSNHGHASNTSGEKGTMNVQMEKFQFEQNILIPDMALMHR